MRRWVRHRRRITTSARRGVTAVACGSRSMALTMRCAGCITAVRSVGGVTASTSARAWRKNRWGWRSGMTGVGISTLARFLSAASIARAGSIGLSAKDDGVSRCGGRRKVLPMSPVQSVTHLAGRTEFGDTPIKVQTPSGGIHLIYRSSGEKTLTRLDGVPVDVRGQGGMAIAPPSINPRKCYAYAFIDGDLTDFGSLPTVRPGCLPLSQTGKSECAGRKMEVSAGVTCGVGNGNRSPVRHRSHAGF